MKKIILASSSPRRKELLNQLGLKFEVAKSNFEEDMSLNMKPKSLARFLSRKKAEDVATKYDDAIIIAADTFISLGDEILGKPHTKERAKKMLRKISGKTLDVITGFTVMDTKSNKKISKSIITKVFIRNLNNSEIKSYVATKEPLDKAGAFGIQEKGVLLIKKIEGSYTNVVGLPLTELVYVLKSFKITIL
jgi:septum formation protein